jgi:6-phosphofructokinase 1
MADVKHIAVLTSGGDAPGMNAAIRAVVRTGLANDLRVTGAVRGYRGLIEREFVEMGPTSVSNIIQTGGTILKTSRSDDFMKPEGRATAARNLEAEGIDAVVGIGGDGTFRGLIDLSREQGVRVVGVPGTIDNDITGTDNTIGFDTAVNTALESIDKIRDTAQSHDRVFFIEVMGRECGAIALEVGLSGGAEAIIVPEVPADVDETCDLLTRGKKRGKTSFIVIVAEGAYKGGAATFAKEVSDRIGVDYRVSILGHVQRGGSPTSFDRVIASLSGREAVNALLAGKNGQMVGVECGRVVLVPLEKAVAGRKTVDLELLKVAHIISQ